MSLTELKQGECCYEPNSVKGGAPFIAKCTDAEKRVRNFEKQEGDCIRSNSQKVIELWKKYEEGIELRVLHIKHITTGRMIKHVIIYNSRSKTYVDMSNGTIRITPENMLWEAGNKLYRTIIIRREQFIKTLEKRSRIEEKEFTLESSEAQLLICAVCNSLFNVLPKMPRGGRKEFKSAHFGFREITDKCK